MSAPRGPRDPQSDIAAAAQRARERLHAEMQQLREGLQALVAEQGSARGQGFRASGFSASLLTSVALLGVIAVASLALLLNQGRSLLGGSLESLPPSGDRSPGTGAKIGAAQAATAVGARAFATPVRTQFAVAPLQGSSLPGDSGSASYRVVVNDLKPVSSVTEKPAGHGHPGHRPSEQAPPSPPATSQPETTEQVPTSLPESPQEPSGGETPRPGPGGEHGGGKTTTGSNDDGHDCEKDRGDDHGHHGGGEGHGDDDSGHHGGGHGGGEGHGDDDSGHHGGDEGHGGGSHGTGHDKTESHPSPTSSQTTDSHGLGRPSSPAPAVAPESPPPVQSYGSDYGDSGDAPSHSSDSHSHSSDSHSHSSDSHSHSSDSHSHSSR